jgi:hypothetical protein
MIDEDRSWFRGAAVVSSSTLFWIEDYMYMDSPKRSMYLRRVAVTLIARPTARI